MHWPPCSTSVGAPARRARRNRHRRRRLGRATREIIAAFARALAVPVRAGVAAARRLPLARLRNLAIAATRPTTWCSSTATCCCIRSSSPITRAARAAAFFTQGVRVHADARADARADRRSRGLPAPLVGAASAGCAVPIYCTRRPAPRCRAASRNGFIAIKGCNRAFWRDDLRARQRLQRSDRGLGSRGQGAVRAARACGRAPPDAAVRRHRRATCTIRRLRAPRCPRISRCWRPRARPAGPCERGLDAHLRA